MSYTTVYHFRDENGVETVINKKNSQMKFMGFKRILLKAGQAIEYVVTGEEQAVVLQDGDFTVNVSYRGKEVLRGVSGERHSVFDELPTAIYLPPEARVEMSSKNGMEARIFTAYCEEGNTPFFCPPEAIEEGEPGSYIYKRKYRKIFGQPGTHNDMITKHLIVGESVSVPGGWIGFPAHRHDYETDEECVLDEIFSFQMTSDAPDKNGGCYQHGYDLDKDGKKLWDEVNVIESNDTAIALPTGFHTTVSMAGSVVYLLWGLAGEGEKKYQVKFDDRYSWLENCLY